MTISPDRRHRRRLVVMVKEPRPGQVKTRLGRDIGLIEAARWFRRQSLQHLRRLKDPRWELWLAVSPDRDGLASRVWPADLPRMPQGPGDLGQRMARILRSVPAGPVCVVGADIPAMRRHHIHKAFGLLGSSDAVFGPAEDGGYWLVGLRRLKQPPPTLFENVRWSSPHALSDSVETLGTDRWAMADRLADVDTADDLQRPGR